jgi:bifunctional ADP-heptose synthase (sugar kinase/adenylyltransferase)
LIKTPRKRAIDRPDRAADPSVDLTRLLDIVAAFPRQTVSVIGDFVLDEFVSGEISRVSREAPVLILRHRRTEVYPGGAANAANNLADLGARVLPVGVVGDDEGGRTLIDYFRRKQVNVSGILRVRGRVTTTKTRYLAGWTHTTEPQVFRDSGVVAATPNEPELEAAYRARVGTDIAKLEELGRQAVRDLAVDALVVTRGKDGMAVFERPIEATGRRSGPTARHIPIYGSDAPVDVTGAGDTVIAVFTLALAAGASYLEAAHLANYAGGIVVMKRRTATVTRPELEAALRREATAQR